MAVLAGTALSLLRHPGTVALDTVWAEDGSIFLGQAARGSTVDAVTTSYAGYFHTVPRLFAEVATAVPPSAAATVLAVGAALVTAALAVVVYAASAGHVTSRLARVLVSAPVVLAPLAQQDVPNTVANLHWPGLYAMFWLLVWVPSSRAGRIVAPVTLVLIALSDILVLAFLSLALVRLAVRRDRYSADLTGALAVPEAVFGDPWLPDGPVDTRRLARRRSRGWSWPGCSSSPGGGPADPDPRRGGGRVRPRVGGELPRRHGSGRRSTVDGRAGPCPDRLRERRDQRRGTHPAGGCALDDGRPVLLRPLGPAGLAQCRDGIAGRARERVERR